MLFSTVLSVAALASLSVAAPAAGGKVIVAINQCDYALTVAKVDLGQRQGASRTVHQGKRTIYKVPQDWKGLFIGRNGCSGMDCKTEHSQNPASVAEFTMGAPGGGDFYDINLTDGYNLPMKVTPHGAKVGSSPTQCGSPVCSHLPSCPNDMKVVIGGKYSSCKSTCSKTSKDEDCCAGEHGTRETCNPSKYSQDMKKACPTVKTYPWDDERTAFICNFRRYDIVFCP